MNKDHVAVRSFGAISFLKPVAVGFDEKIFKVNPDDLIPLIPGFVAGAPYDICPLSKILEKIGCNLKIRRIERIGTRRWKYCFEDTWSDWQVMMLVVDRKKWEEKYRRQILK